MSQPLTIASPEPFRAQFEQVVRKHVRFIATDAPIPYDEELVAIGLDSIGTINLLLDLEAALDVSLPGGLLTPETFRTAGTLERAFASVVGGNMRERA